MSTAAQARPPTRLDRAMAWCCLHCPVCRTARRKQKGAAFAFTSKVESRACPFCRAYRKVFGRSAHEPAAQP